MHSKFETNDTPVESSNCNQTSFVHKDFLKKYSDGSQGSLLFMLTRTCSLFWFSFPLIYKTRRLRPVHWSGINMKRQQFLFRWVKTWFYVASMERLGEQRMYYCLDICFSDHLFTISTPFKIHLALWNRLQINRSEKFKLSEANLV